MSSTPTGLPPVAIMPHKTVKGINTLEELSFEGISLLPRVSFEEAFFTPWPTDAHFVSYAAYEGQEMLDAWPRCNQTALSHLRGKGTDLLTTMLVFEWDRPDHASGKNPWLAQEDAQAFFKTRITALPDFLSHWTLFYTTLNGARLVYVLDDPIPVDAAQTYHAWFCEELTKRGKLNVDMNCSDWTRLMRLPMVHRDGRDQADQPWFMVELQEDKRLSRCLLEDRAASHTQHALATEMGLVRRYEGKLPHPDDCRKMLEVVSRSGNTVETAFYKQAKRHLAGQDCYACLFEHAPLALAGSRNATLTSYVGKVCQQLYGMAGTTPETIYALFLPAVECLEPDQQTPRWDVVLWDLVCRMWGREVAKAQGRIAEQEKKIEILDSLEDRIIAGMREWCDDPQLSPDPLPGTDERTREDVKTRIMAFIMRRLILTPHNQYYIMTPSGWYDKSGVAAHLIIPRIREMQMESLLPTRVLDPRKQEMTDRSVTSIINDHVKVVEHLEGVAEKPGAYYEGNVIKVPMYRRNPDLTPLFDAQVDEWLRLLFSDNYEKAAAWIGHALAWEDGPICALSIVGKAGAGKKMLVQGLAECLETPAWAPAEELVGDTQYQLMKSPFLVVNEGWPLIRGSRPIDKFRQVVGGDAMAFKRKWKEDVIGHTPMRVILTANGGNNIDGLIQGQFMTVDDRIAVGIRILHYDVGDFASDWLKEKGGKEFTAASGRRWIAGDSGEASDFIVARHFLWLWENRPKPDSRFLVEGNGHQELMMEMSSQSGQSPAVYECLARMIETPKPPTQGTSAWGKGFAITKEGQVFVSPAAVHEYHRKEMDNEAVQGRHLTIKSVSDVLKGLKVKSSGAGNNRISFQLVEFPEKGYKRWIEVDLRPLFEVAEKYGWPCDKMRKLLGKED